MERLKHIFHIAVVILYHLHSCFGFPDLSLTNEPQSGSVPVNSSLLLRCQAGGQEPITYFWRYNGQRIDPSPPGGGALWTVGNTTLRVGAVNNSTWGMYQCCAGNVYGVLCSRNASVTYTWIGLPQVLLPGDTEFDRSPRVVQQGYAIRLLCHVDAIPDRPKVTWLKDGSPMHSSNRIINLPEGGDILHITSSRLSDSGQYSCVASNKHGENRTSTNVTISVESKSSDAQTNWGIYMGPEIMDAVATSNVILECLLWTSENTEVTWRRRDGRHIPPERSERYGQSNLLLRNVTTNDTAEYECVARDPVFGDVDFARAYLYVLQPPFLQSPMEDLERNESMFGRLQCNVTGSPPPYEVTWYHNGEKVAITGRVSQKRSDQLGIWASMTQDTGIYQCFAINEAGVTWGALFYNVIVPEHRPLPVSNVSVEVRNSRSVIVRWQPPNQTDLKGYSIYYYPTIDGSWDAKVAHRDVNEFLMDSLQPFTNYTFQVKAFVSWGGSQLTPPVFALTEEAKPENVPRFWLTSNSPFSINISWEQLRVEDRNGVINSYKICYKKRQMPEMYTCFEKSADIDHLLLNDLEEATEYSVKMAAANSMGFGPDSHWAHINTMEIDNCTLPVSLLMECSVLNSTAVQIQWSLESSGLPPGEGEARVEGYKLTLTSFSDHSQQMRIFPADTRRVILGNLEPNTAYNLEMQGYNDCSEGYVTASVFQLNRFDFDKDTNILLPPFNLEAQVLSSTSINLRWNAPQTAFEVGYYSVRAEPTRGHAMLEEVNSRGTSAMLGNLEPFTEYKLTVRAVGIDLTSSYSSPIYKRTKEGLPSQPTDVSLLPDPRRPEVLCVSWQSPVNPRGIIVEYQVTYYSLNDTQLGYPNQIVSTNGSVLNVSVHTLKENHLYFFLVRAFTSVGAGPFSKRHMYTVRSGPTVGGEEPSTAEQPFAGLGSDLEKGIVIGIVLATLCIMICTLLLLVRHRKDCRHQFCVTRKEEGQGNDLEMVGDSSSADKPIYRPRSTHPAQPQHAHGRAQEDPHSKVPLLNGHIPTTPQTGYLMNTTLSTTNTTSSYSQHLPPHHGQDLSLPQTATTGLLSSTTPQPQNYLQQQQHPPPPPECRCREEGGHQHTRDIDETHRCVIHGHHPDDSSSAYDERRMALQLREHAHMKDSDSPPRPASYRGTNSDSGMDGDLEWDLGDETDSGGHVTGGVTMDPATYLSSDVTSCHGDYKDTSPDFISKALYLCSSGNVNHA